MSLIPEKPIVISPTLAATIGLEETVFLQLLQECLSHGNPVTSSGFDWITVPADKILHLASLMCDACHQACMKKVYC
jgi:hypothetical protein